MKLKFMMASMGASFERFVGKLQNHEAIAQCAIADLRQAAARVRSEGNQLQRRLANLHDEKSRLDSERQRWRERAKTSLAKDEQRAMECLKQEKRLAQCIHKISGQCAKLDEVAATLRDNLGTIESRLEELEAKRALFASREASLSAAPRTSADVDGIDGDTVFQRWEHELLVHEAGLPVHSSTDDIDCQLAREFATEEEAQSLASALAELKRECASQTGGARED